MSLDTGPVVTLADRRQRGRDARKSVPRSSHAEWKAPADRPDPIGILEAQNDDRLEWLLPIRHGRMSVSPFTFYRGAAGIMAADLSRTPTSGITVQACGDAHLSNFGTYASPERNLVFDVNDFDETNPGPWEWDVKRLAASFMIASRHRGFDADTAAAITEESVAAYRAAMREYSQMRTLQLWYDHLDLDHATLRKNQPTSKSALEAISALESKARKRDNLQALRKLAMEVDGQYRIRSDPPVLLPLVDLPPDANPDDLVETTLAGLEAYKSTLAGDRRHLLEHYRPVDIAFKVVGVGSVGTRCLIGLFEGRDRDDPLFLQIKEAGRSVLEPFTETSAYENQGQRVVEGQRLMQAVSDLFLGWATGAAPENRHFYIRQLRDWKGSVDVETASVPELELYAWVCGWTLARAHARSGDPVAITAYLGTGSTFDRALVTFSRSYAEQNDHDYEAFTQAIADGRLPAETGR